MEQTLCCICGAGEYYGDETIPANAFVIAADGGLRFCRAQGTTPDVIIGDFDSLGFAAAGNNVIQLPVEKDDTDTLAAVKFALEKGYRRFWLLGCTGGRLSHTVANLQTLTYLAKRGAAGILFDKEEIATVTGTELAFTESAAGFLSVFAAEAAVTLSESGLQYPAKQMTFTADFPLGVSNAFTGAAARIEVHEGYALVVANKALLSEKGEALPTH
ncbi:MAG: thiamine diphosphokinase [Clostridia bacterium]|nr:thiamine diphosphokinase [Clostridia bacterium]